VKCTLIGTDVADVERTFNDRFGVTDTGAVLVRPDGYIAWRSKAVSPQSLNEARAAIQQVLGRSSRASKAA
jgi:putative polyketide hydroxylase